MEENSNQSSSNEKSKTVPTNFSIERILLKSDNEQSIAKPKTLNKVTANPWISSTPILFKPKVVIAQPQPLIQTSPLSMPVSSTAVPPPSSSQIFPQINPLYSHLLQQLPSASNLFPSDREKLFNAEFHQNLRTVLPGLAGSPSSVCSNNLVSVNNYNYFFENHFKQVQSTSNYLNASASQLLALNNNPHTIDSSGASRSFVFPHHELSNGSSSSIIGDLVNLDDGLKCSICNKMFGCAETLEAHEKSHRSPRYECEECGKGFSQLRNFKYHVSVHRGTKEFAAKCPECGKIFNDKGYLSSHMKIHRNKKEYECPHCPKSFNQRVAFNMHIRIHTGVKPHKCETCGKKFSRKMLLKQHARTHSGEKPYQCTVCGKTFADRSNMTLHHRLHSGVKPFACPICPKAFTKKHHLKTHLNYHTGYKPYKCPHENCGQTFTQSSNMRTHAKKCQFKPG